MTVRTSSRSVTVACALTVVTLLAAPLAPTARAAFPAPLHASHFAVATDTTEASQAAARVLHAGGNAADGAIAAVLALGVASANASGFGGGGFATVCLPDGACTFLDFRETAPAQLTIERIRDAPDASHASQTGGLAVAVPGEPAGMIELSRRFGRVPLARSVAPAVDLARRGFTVTPSLTDRIVVQRANLAADGPMAAVFLPGGNPLVPGVRVRRPRLAATLARFGREGERYLHGAFADSIAHTVRAHGGVLAADDIRGYRVVERAPLRMDFRGNTVVTAPPPSAGGLLLLETLALIDTLPAAQLSFGSSAYDHALATAFRGAFDDRARYVGDPTTNLATANAAVQLLAPERLAQRARAFDPARTAPVVVIDPARDHGTTHVCVIDADGMAVSLTTTVNLVFGARFADPALDVVLNDEIDDFSLGTQGNNFNLASAGTNTLAAGRRPISSMTPTVILRDGHPFACVGAAGGPRIATATTQVLLAMLLHGMDPEAAVSSPRIHHQGAPDELLVDREVPDDVRSALRARGYTVTETTTPLAIVQAVTVHTVNGAREVLAASDPRKGGLPAGE